MPPRWFNSPVLAEGEGDAAPAESDAAVPVIELFVNPFNMIGWHDLCK